MNAIFVVTVLISISLLAMWMIEYRMSRKPGGLLPKFSILASLSLMIMILLIPVGIWLFRQGSYDFWFVARIFITSLLFTISIALLLKLFEYVVVKDMLQNPDPQEYVGEDTQPFLVWGAKATMDRLTHGTTKAITFREIHSRGSQSQELDAISREINLLVPE
jgi:hypothetical protein